jgi:hypothetical protein
MKSRYENGETKEHTYRRCGSPSRTRLRAATVCLGCERLIEQEGKEGGRAPGSIPLHSGARRAPGTPSCERRTAGVRKESVA